MTIYKYTIREQRFIAEIAKLKEQMKHLQTRLKISEKKPTIIVKEYSVKRKVFDAAFNRLLAERNELDRHLQTANTTIAALRSKKKKTRPPL